MRTRLFFLLLYLGFWIVYFQTGRVVFLVYQWRHTSQLNGWLVSGALLHGLKMDAAIASPLTLVPLCIVARAGFLPDSLMRRTLLGYTLGMLALCTVGIAADLELFRILGYRLDTSPIRYLESPGEAFASASASPLFLLTGLAIAMIAAAGFAYNRLLAPILKRIPPSTQWRSFLLLAVALPLLTLGTGSFGRVPLDAGSVYFSENSFANQAAINPVWNFAASLRAELTEETVHRHMDSAAARRIVDSLLGRQPVSESRNNPKLLRHRPQKIVLVFWEALTAKIVEPQGGRHGGITTGFTQLASEGILFENIYAAGPRTTNGLVAALGGLPSHPTANALESARRAAALPSLSMSMAAAGYRTGFYYGGPLSFDSRNRYLLRGDYHEILEKKDFHRRDWKSPWGVHDPFVLERLFRAIDAATAPLFAVTLTLSSHEPFRVPSVGGSAARSAEQRFLESQAYTDTAVFDFVQRAKSAPWWNTTLIVIIADHGSPYPFTGSPLASAPEHYRVPMLWLGGALSVRDTVVAQIGSLSDIPRTLLGQLGIPAAEYRWGRDILSPDYHGFAFYSFRDGFGYVDGSGSYVYDNVAESVIHRVGNPGADALTAGRAFQQSVMQEYLELAAPRR